jgi:hypothetical protein
MTGLATSDVAAPAAASLRATFTPATTAYLASAATTAAAVRITGTSAASIAIAVTVPLEGYFAATVPTGTVTLHGAAGTGVFTGMLQIITVSEGRNWAPGWSVLGQESDFIGRRGARPRTIAGTQLGWVPTGTVVDGATLGSAVPPGDPGQSGAGVVLAAAAAGSGLGTQILSADLTLIIRAGASGPYSGVLTITYLESASLPASPSQSPLPQTG